MSSQIHDVIVLGAGSIGLPAAVFLAQAGLRPLVIDQFTSPGQGSNKAAIGGIRATHSTPAKIRLWLEAIDVFSSWQARYGDDIEWYRGGYAFVADGEHEEQMLKELLKVQRAYGLNTPWLDRGGYATEVVINAAGAWAQTVARLVGLDVPVIPDSHEVGITEGDARFLEPMVVDIRPARDSRNYCFYQHRPGPVAFCITPDPPIVGTDHRDTATFLALIARPIVNLMPKLTNVKVCRTWRGLYPMTPDGSPIVGRAADLDGYIYAVGMCDQGDMLGPGVGELLTRMVRREQTPDDEDALAELSPCRDFGRQEALA
jgi:sarcosine oxidase subunit beta